LSQYVNSKPRGDGKILTSVRVGSRTCFVRGVEALSLAGEFAVLNRVRNVEVQLPVAAMFGIALHVWMSMWKGKSVLRCSLKGEGTCPLKGKINPELLTMFDMHMKWNADEKIWSSEPDDDLSFAKIESVADYIETLGINFSKNLSQMDPNLLLEIPYFLAHVVTEVVKVKA
jgi:hypothetical protein